MKMNSKNKPGKGERNHAISRLAVVAAIVIVAASCSSTPTAVRPTTTGKTVATSTPPPEQQVIIDNLAEPDPGIVDTEIYEGGRRDRAELRG